MRSSACLGPNVDYVHPYEGFQAEQRGACRARLFHRDPASPIVVASSLGDRTTPWLASMCEFLAAELLMRHFPMRARADEPMVYIEHYPQHRDAPWMIEAMIVAFTPAQPRWDNRWRRWTMDRPVWRRLERDELTKLLGCELT